MMPLKIEIDINLTTMHIKKERKIREGIESNASRYQKQCFLHYFECSVLECG
jgi:hypothetical protein